MKIRLFYTSLILLLLSTLLLTNTFAQDYTQLGLPEGAKARLGKGVITDIQLSPDNTRLAIASSIGVWLYDVSTRAQTAPLIRYDKHTASQMVFSPNSKMLAISTHDQTIQLWNAVTGENLLTFSTSGGPFTALKFLIDNKTLVSQNRKGTVWFWDITTEKQLKTLSPKLPKIRLGKARIFPLATDMFVDHTGRVTFAVGNEDGTISIQDGQTGHHIRKLIVQTDDSLSLPIQYPKPYTYQDNIDGQPAMKWINGFHFSPDGKTLVNGVNYQIAYWGGGSRLRGGPTEIWDVETGQQLALLPYGIGIDFLGDGKTLAITGYRESVIWDIKTRRKIEVLPKVRKIKFSGDGKTFVTIDKNGYKIWDIETRREIAAHSPVVEWLEVFPERFLLSEDGSILITADENGTVALWETKNTKQLRALITGYTKPFTALAFAPDGTTLASGDNIVNLQLWDTDRRSKQHTIKTGHNSLQGLAFATNNVTLTAFVGRDIIQQWDITTKKQTTDYNFPNTSSTVASSWFGDGTSFQLKALAFTPNGEKLVIRNDKTSTTEIWNITTDRPPQRLTGVASLWGPISLTPDGHILATQSDSRNAADLWHAHTGDRIATLKASKNWIDKLSAWFHDTMIYALGFASDGKTLAVSTRNKEIQLWNITTHQRVGTLKAHKHVVCELVFSPDSTILASGDTGGVIHLWKLPMGNHLITYEGHKNDIRTLAFAPDGQTLASISRSDGTILFWKVPTK